jgi:hypothetical protein
MWAILLIGQCFSRASSRCSSYNLLLGSINMVDLCLWGALSRHSSWTVFTPPRMCIPICLDWAHQLMYVYDQLLIIISSSGMLATWYWLWTIKALIEAEVFWWLYSNLQGHSSSIDHCQTFSVFIIRLAKDLFLREKCFSDTGCACTSSVASKRAIIERLAKNLIQGKKCLSISDVHQCIVVIA